MHFVQNYFSGEDWANSPMCDVNYIGGLENVVSALLKAQSVKKLPGPVQAALAELAEAAEASRDSLGMYDAAHMVTVKGTATVSVGDNYVKYDCLTEVGANFVLAYFPPDKNGGEETFKLKTLTGEKADEEIFCDDVRYKRTGYDGKAAKGKKWLDSVKGAGVAFHYDNGDGEFVLRLEGCDINTKDDHFPAACVGELLEYDPEDAN